MAKKKTDLPDVAEWIELNDIPESNFDKRSKLLSTEHWVAVEQWIAERGPRPMKIRFTAEVMSAWKQKRPLFNFAQKVKEQLRKTGVKGKVETRQDREKGMGFVYLIPSDNG